MDLQVTSQEEKYRKRGWIISIVWHILLLILLFIPFLTYPDPPPGQEGITVNLGIPEFDNIEDSAPSAANTDPEPVKEDPVKEPEPIPEPKKPEPEPVKEKEMVKTEDPEAIALKKKKAEEERKRQEQVEKQRQEEAARRKAEEDQKRREAEAEANKKKFSDLFKNSGTGDSDKNAGGDPDGKPNTGQLDKISTGAGTVTGALTGRGAPVSSPKITDNSQKTGRVAIKVCVDAGGNVVSAKYTQSGSTTGDASLKAKAVANAKRWKFPKGSQTDCGTITYTFKLQ